MGERIESLSRLREILFSRIGRWRTDFLWRFFGLVICQLGILLLHDTDTVEKFLLFPIGFHMSLACGLLLILFGPRLILLFLTSVAMFIFLVPWIGEVVERQVADEYVLLLILPTVGVCLTLICSLRKDTRDKKEFELDAAHISVFRISVVIAMFFATFHKLNADFFNPEVSCASVLSKELSLWWRLPFPRFMLNVKPYQIVLGEGLIPVLLIFYPRTGILFTLLFLGLIGHIGPTVFTMIMFMMACAFFRREDGVIILKGLKRYWSWLLVFILIASGISSKLYAGKRTWFEFHLYQSVMIALVFCVLCSFTADWKERRNSAYLKNLLRPRFNLRTLFPSDKAIRTALISFALLSFLNGMSPYFGLKYRLSFAMLSNLRVDEARWNSLLIPEWFYLPRHSPFIRVTRVEADRYTLRRLAKLEHKRKRQLQVGLISPMSFKYRLEILRRLNANVAVEFTYRGQSHVYEDAAGSKTLEKWLEGIPDSKMFQEWLSTEGAQPCVH